MLVNELHCDPDNVHAAATFYGDLGFDDQDFETLSDAIDHEFGVLYPQNNLVTCPTVGHLVMWIDRDE